MQSVSTSPSKGKSKESTQWRTGWWDFWLLVEKPRRPLEWSRSSVIFSAHPTQPLLTARHFSSSKQFIIQSPSPIMSSPGSFAPPAVISVAPGDDWLFAYFPCKEGDSEGTGCLWSRGAQIDSWSIKEWWKFPYGGGAVAVNWLGSQREWIPDASGSFTRLPFKGPITPVSGPTLLVVTQDHQVHLFYLRHYTSSLKMIKCSLSPPGIAFESHLNLSDGLRAETQGVRQCSDASIGLAYNESSMIVATRSRQIPPPAIRDSQLDDLVLNAEIDLTQPALGPGSKSRIWEPCGEENIIEIFEVQLKFDGQQMVLAAQPIQTLNTSGSVLMDLTFFCVPPGIPLQPEPFQPPSSPKKVEPEKAKLYLTAIFLDFGDFSTTPKSELILYSFTRQQSGTGFKGNKFTWIPRTEATRAFDSDVLSFIVPTLYTMEEPILYLGKLQTSGSIGKLAKSPRDVQIGTVCTLKIPDLREHEKFESLPMLSAQSKVGRDLPLRSAISPNRLLLCTLSSLSWPLQVAIHKLPRANLEPDTISFVTSMSNLLVVSILGKKSFADVTHSLSLVSVKLSDVVEVLYRSLATLGSNSNGLLNSATKDFLGVALETYRTRALRTRDENEGAVLAARWQAAKDICSLVACNVAFEDCKKGDRYDFDAAWQLNNLCGWIVEFIERLMKECVLSFEFSQEHQDASEDNSQTVKTTPPSSKYSAPPTLLTLVHPYVVQNFILAIQHIKRYRSVLGSSVPGSENAQIARDVLIDLVDLSGVDLAALSEILEEAKALSEQLEKNDCDAALASCQPTTKMYPQLNKTLAKIVQSNVLEKASLFIKPFDLVDSVAQLAMSTQRTDKETDVISKETLTKHMLGSVCLRCGGNSEVNSSSSIPQALKVSKQWVTWEKMWTLHCICGGLWSSVTMG